MMRPRSSSAHPNTRVRVTPEVGRPQRGVPPRVGRARWAAAGGRTRLESVGMIWKNPLIVAAMLLLSGVVVAEAAETTTPVPMTKTIIALALDSQEPLAIRTQSLQKPPRLVIEFPSRRVTGALPEQSAIGRGVIKTIRTRYDRPFVRSVEIVLTDSYAAHVRSEAGRILIEIDHPTAINRMDMEVGVKRGTIVGARGARNPVIAPRPLAVGGTVVVQQLMGGRDVAPTGAGLPVPRAPRPDRGGLPVGLHISERFRAMQEALASATPIPWTATLTPAAEQKAASVPSAPQPASLLVPRVASRTHLLSGTPSTSSSPATSPSGVGLGWWIGLALCVVLAGAGWWVIARQSSHSGVSGTSGTGKSQLSAGMTLIDQLVWRAFERQGYQVVMEQEIVQPPWGTLRVMMKDGNKTALLCAGNGPFFEKQTVERLIRTMKDARVDQGFLVAAASFTVPAQRLAKEHHVTLIGREELTELLSAGAASEYVTKQLDQQRQRLEEAKETLEQYASELDSLRRQRNEASWFLGEERTKSATLEQQSQELHHQLRSAQAERERWEREALAQRKQWEESEWYLGESRLRLQRLETQLDALQGMAKQLALASGERDDAQRALSEAHTARESLERMLTELQQALESAAAREQALQETLYQLQGSVTDVRHWGGGRRQHKRVPGGMTRLELHHGRNGSIFAGALEDVSRDGFRIETEQRISPRAKLRVRLLLSNASEAIESRARLIWQQSSTTTSCYQSGYQLVDVDEQDRTHLEQAIEAA